MSWTRTIHPKIIQYQLETNSDFLKVFLNLEILIAAITFVFCKRSTWMKLKFQHNVIKTCNDILSRSKTCLYRCRTFHSLQSNKELFKLLLKGFSYASRSALSRYRRHVIDGSYLVRKILHHKLDIPIYAHWFKTQDWRFRSVLRVELEAEKVAGEFPLWNFKLSIDWSCHCC